MALHVWCIKSLHLRAKKLKGHYETLADGLVKSTKGSTYKDRHGRPWRFSRSLGEIVRTWWFSVFYDEHFPKDKKDDLWPFITFWTQFMAITVARGVRARKSANSSAEDTEPHSSRALHPTPEPLPQ